MPAKLVLSNSEIAARAYALVTLLQKHFEKGLSKTARQFALPAEFKPVSWLRHGGAYGGGSRLVAPFDRAYSLCNRGSINVSQVHYPRELNKPLASATALSTIIHPFNPYAPSIHMHISLTEPYDKKPYWRLMVDLNPSIPNSSDTEQFNTALRDVTGDLFEVGQREGQTYFYIPALKRHRGMSHFYLEQYHTEDQDADFALAQRFGQSMMDTYLDILSSALKNHPHSSLTADDRQCQLAYHTVYFFQVLTLDRGTTAGILVHNENDVGILGSLPAFINRRLLASYKQYMSDPQTILLDRLLACLPEDSEGEGGVFIDEAVKVSLAQSVREFYKEFPQALKMQASASITPETVANHSQKSSKE